MAQNDGIYTDLCAFKLRQVLDCIRFKMAIKYRKCQYFHVFFSSSYLQKWSQTTLFIGCFVAEKAFAVFRGFKVAQNDGTYTGVCTFLPQNPVYWDGFKLCTL